MFDFDNYGYDYDDDYGYGYYDDGDYGYEEDDHDGGSRWPDPYGRN